MKRLKAIEERMAAIATELDNDGADLDALETELRGLTEERTNLLDAAEKRKQLRSQVAVGGGIVVETPPTEEERAFGVDSPEYRSAYLKHIRQMTLTGVEQRAFSSASASAGAVLPTQTANEIIKKMKQYAPLLGEITLLQVAGNVTFAAEDTVSNAALHTENASITAATDKLTAVTLGSYEIAKLVQVSKTVVTMAIDSFEAWLVEMLAERVSAAITRYLISGTGSSQPAGVGSITYNTSNSVTVAAASSLTVADVLAHIGLLGGGYDKNAKYLMSKKTLFTDFMPLRDDSKNNIVTVSGKDYFVFGYPVHLDEDVPLHEAYLGDFKKIVGNLSEAINVVSGFDINTNSFKYLGTAMFDSKVADAAAFVKLAKATS